MKKPKLSLIIIVYDMPKQAMNTLYSFSSAYQKNVQESDYEIIVVENSSKNTLDSDSVLALGSNFQYYLREENGISPVPAINFGVKKSSGEYLGLIIDGARLVTPRVIELAMMAFQQSPHSMVAVPGYNLGPSEQQHHLSYEYDENLEENLLKSINWKKNGYRLFDIANLSGANHKGPLQLFLECNCIFTNRNIFDSIGGADERFNLLGGGSINLHIYRKIGTHQESQYYFVLPGEGSFHQFHGGVTTSSRQNREDLLESFRIQLDDVWGGQFGGALKREPIILGAITSNSLRFLIESSKQTTKRFEKLAARSVRFWPDDLPFDRYTASGD
jgi:glycosyltransferase involved in cell wall biosynthesis